MSFLEMVFGCSHKRCSFPISAKSTQRRSEAASVTGTYVVCLECGKEFAYDWEAMKIIRNSHRRGEAAVATVPNRKAA
jgi:RNase P subunit RPR2